MLRTLVPGVGGAFFGRVRVRVGVGAELGKILYSFYQVEGSVFISYLLMFV